MSAIRQASHFVLNAHFSGLTTETEQREIPEDSRGDAVNVTLKRPITNIECV